MTVTEPAVIHMDEYQNVVRATAADVWRRNRDHVPFEDLVQEGAVWWYGKGQRYLPDYLTDENYGRLRRSLWRWMDVYARAQKAQAIGYEPRDQYPYHPREVLDLIPIALDPQGLPVVGYADEGPGNTHKGNLAEGGDLLAALIDVRRALAQVPEDDLHFLTLADDCSYDWERVATRLADGVLPDSHRRRHARIAERMARWLSNNTLEDYPYATH